MSTFSISHSGDSGGNGSSLVTSSAAPAKLFARSAAHQRVFVDEDAAANIDQVSLRPQPRQAFRIHEVMRLRRDWQSQHHEVGVGSAPHRVRRTRT